MKTFKLSNISRSKLLATALTTACLLLASAPGLAKDNIHLQNMERDRASLLATYLHNEDAAANVAQQQRIYRRLTDTERMVLRDDRIVQDGSVHAKRVFANYDLSFLVHGAAEQERSVISHWLTKVGVSTKALDKTNIGRKP